MENAAKLLFVREFTSMDEANKFEAELGDKYRFERWSETKGVYIFIRRSR